MLYKLTFLETLLHYFFYHYVLFTSQIKVSLTRASQAERSVSINLVVCVINTSKDPHLPLLCMPDPSFVYFFIINPQI